MSNPAPEEWKNPLRSHADRRLPRIAGPSGMVIFGVTGDLAKRKLLPAIYDLAYRGLLPAGFTLVGFGRRPWSKEEFENYVREQVEVGARTDFDEHVWDRLAEGMHFVQGAFDDDAAFDNMAELLDHMDATRGTAGNWAFYLSVPPEYFSNVIDQLDRTGMAKARDGQWRRVPLCSASAAAFSFQSGSPASSSHSTGSSPISWASSSRSSFSR